MQEKKHALPAAVLVVFKKDGQVLMGRRQNAKYANGLLCPPAGGVEQGESFTRAAIREVREEVGVTINETQLTPFHFMYCKDVQGIEWLNMYFMVEEWRGEFVIAEPDKCSELIWINSYSLPGDVIPEIRQGITQGLSGNFYSEFITTG